MRRWLKRTSEDGQWQKRGGGGRWSSVYEQKLNLSGEINIYEKDVRDMIMMTNSSTDSRPCPTIETYTHK